MKKLPKGAGAEPKKAAAPTWTAAEHETALIKSFVIAERRDRMAFLLRSNRRKPIHELAHFQWFDTRRVVDIDPNSQSPQGILGILINFGAPQTCHVISEYSEYDGKSMDLSHALEELIGQGVGSVISCIPGQLAFYEGEGPEDRFILRKTAKP